LGYGFAYRVLDAQWFGVAQRRRRVFVVGCLGDWQRPAQVLFERESVRRDTAPSREKGQEVAATIAARFGVSRNNHEELAWDENGIQRTVGTLCADTHPGAYSGQDAYTGRLVPHTFSTPAIGDIREDNVSSTMTKNTGAGGETQNPAFVAQPITFSAQMSVPQTDVDLVQTLQAKNPMAVAHTLTARMYSKSSPDPGAGRGGPVVVAHPVHYRKSRRAQSTTDHETWVEDDATNTLNCFDVGDVRATDIVAATMQVRRLTPVECERLQGFPDNYTNIPWRKKPESPDGPRYKALGNSMAVPVMRWIGERIAKVDA